MSAVKVTEAAVGAISFSCLGCIRVKILELFHWRTVFSLFSVLKSWPVTELECTVVPSVHRTSSQLLEQLKTELLVSAAHWK